MFCLQCGKELKEGAKFCPYCGAVTRAADPGQPVYGSDPSGAAGFGATEPAAGAAAGSGFSATEPANGSAPGYGYSVPQTGASTPGYSYGATARAGGSAGPTPPSGGKGRGKGLIIGGAVAAVAVVALVVFALSGLFASPKARVEKALAKTISAYQQAREKIGLPDFGELSKSRSASQSVSLALNSVNSDLVGMDLSSLRGLGVRISSDLDLEGRELGYDAAAFWGSDDIASFQITAQNNVLCFASPEFTGGKAYGFNTKTLGEDLYRLTSEDEVRNLSFNIFDMIEKLTPDEDETKETQQAIQDANLALLKAMEVEKAGKESLKVNGKTVNAAAYHVTIPKDALRDYFDALIDTMEDFDLADRMESMYESMGIPMDDIRYELEELRDSMGELGDILDEAAKSLGSLEFDVFVDGGYVCAALYEKKISGSKVKLELYLGGGDNYVDDWTLELTIDGETLSIESTGDHGAKSGVYTDETVIRVPVGSSAEPAGGTSKMNYGRLTSEVTYDLNGSKDNFQWTLTVDSAGSLELEGTLSTAKDSLVFEDGDLSLRASGVKVCSLEVEYELKPYDKARVKLDSPNLLGDMSERDLEDLFYDLYGNAEDWSSDLMSKFSSRIPDSLYWYLRYLL